MEKKELTENSVVADVKDKTGIVDNESTAVQTVTDTGNAESKKESAPASKVEPEVFLQYREYEVTMEAVTERVKAHYYAKGYKEGTIEDIQIYVKPEDFTAYYVINDGVVGKVNLF